MQSTPGEKSTYFLLYILLSLITCSNSTIEYTNYIIWIISFFSPRKISYEFITILSIYTKGNGKAMSINDFSQVLTLSYTLIIWTQSASLLTHVSNHQVTILALHFNLSVINEVHIIGNEKNLFCMDILNSNQISI